MPSDVRAARIGSIQNQIASWQLLQTGATTNANGELVGSQKQLQDELNKRSKIQELEAKRDALAGEGEPKAPPPPGLDQAPDDLTDKPTRTARQTLRSIGYGLHGLGATSRAWGQVLNRRLGNVQTPGGVWLPIGVLLFTWLALIPVNGHTRLKWLWMVFLNDAHIDQVKHSPMSQAPGATPNPPPSKTGIGDPQITIQNQGQGTLFPLDYSNMNYLLLMNTGGFE